VDDVEVVAEREVLIDDFNSERGGVARTANADLVSFKDVIAVIDFVDTRDAFDQGGFTCAVIADERGDLSWVDVKVDATQYMDGTKRFIYSAERKDCFSHKSASGFLYLLFFGGGELRDVNGATVVYLWGIYEERIPRIQGGKKREARRITPTGPALLIFRLT